MSTPVDLDLLNEAAEWLARHAGLRFNPEQPTALWHALGQRAHTLHLPDRRAYLRHLRQEKTEWLRLAEEVAVHETTFFRHAGQFRVLSELVLPELVRQRTSQRRLRLWSAACATGEEPYSLAIAVHRLNLPAGWQVDIRATDLSTRALEVAEQGVFDKRRLRMLAPELVARYFEPQGERYRLCDDVRRQVTFSQFNLTQTEPLPDQLCEMDVVFCANVLIYFLPEAVRCAVDHLRAALCTGGYLFLGYAETLYGMSDGFTTLSFGDAYLYRRETPAAVEATARVTPARPAAPPPRPLPPVGLRPVPARAVPLRPSLTQIETLIHSGDLSGATRLAEQWLSLEPELLVAQFTLARLYAAQTRAAEAADLLRRLLVRHSLHAPSYVLLGILCYQQDELEEALAQFQHALYLEPKTPLAYFFLGNIYQQRGQLSHAIHAYRNANRAVAHLTPAWDTGFTPELLIQVCERNIARLEKAMR